MITKLPAFAARTSRRLLHSSVPRAVASAVQPKWSGSLSYGTPEADFTALHVSANSATMESEWSQQLSFASPESDFAAQNVSEATDFEWSKDLSFASPESDFTALHVSANSATAEAEWSQQLSFASPESDFTAQEVGNAPQVETNREDVLQLQVSANSAAAESEWAEQILLANAKQEMEQLQANLEAYGANQLDAEAMELMVQQMMLSSPESATGHVHAAETLSLPLKAQLATLATPLPTTLEEALQQDERRAIVVTTVTSPFRVVHVNESWEGLCGYTQAEAENKPIGALLKGPETQQSQEMIQQIKEHPEAPHSALLVNYTKTGRKFHNRLQVGPLYSKDGIEYLVGVLQEVNDEGHQMAA